MMKNGKTYTKPINISLQMYTYILDEKFKPKKKKKIEIPGN